ARADQPPAGQVAVLLRHRLRVARRAHRERAVARRDRPVARRRHPRVHLDGGHDRGDRAAVVAAVHRVLHGQVPHRAAAGRPARQAPPRAGRAPARRARGRAAQPVRLRGRLRRTSAPLTTSPARPPARAPRRTLGADTMTADAPRTGLTYAAAGVDTEAGDKAVELMKDAVRRTHGPQVLGGVGGFAGLYDFSEVATYRRPLLATSTDGVGTKVAIAQALDVHDTIGFDLVGMVVDDIVVVGAKPLFMTDYIACGKVVPERIAGI